MEASRRERIILYGVVPIAAALIGAIGTVLATKIFGSGDAGDAIKAVVADKSMAAPVKAKMIELINNNDKQFYDFMRSLAGTGSMLIALLIGSGFFSRR